MGMNNIQKQYPHSNKTADGKLDKPNQSLGVNSDDNHFLMTQFDKSDFNNQFMVVDK